ncbi:hypothetical protein RB195_005515 [Necator americanus]|uniref:L-Fucosyltransferase n=1 Tax=Necator americanus TaxID=51031 RepID=A0ABR1BS30_NECAM
MQYGCRCVSYSFMFIFTAFLLTSHVRLKNQKFVALKPNHERLGNQLYQLASGFGIARKLGRTLYYPLAEGAAENLRCYLSLIQATFPRTGTIYRIIPKHLVEQTSVPFAVDENGKRTCCRYDDPSRFIGHPAKFLLLEMSFAQNSKYFEDYLFELRWLFNFSSQSENEGNLRLRQLNIDNSTEFMCVHIRRTDFLSYGVESNLNSTLTATKNIAMKKGLSNFLIFGDDQEFMRSLAAKLVDDTMFGHSKTVRASAFSEMTDLYISYSVCSAFLMIYYYKDRRPTDDYKLLKDEFALKSWHRYDG